MEISIYTNTFVKYENTSFLLASLNWKVARYYQVFYRWSFQVNSCSNVESISSILSAAWNKTKSSNLISRFLRDFLGMVGVLKRDGLDFETLWIIGTECNCHSTGQELTFFTTFYNFFFKMIDTYDWMIGR